MSDFFVLCLVQSEHLCPLGRVWVPPAAMVEEDEVNSAEEEVDNAERCSGLLIFGNLYSSCSIQTEAPSEVHLVLGQANAAKYYKVHVQLSEEDRKAGDKSYTTESEQMRFLLAHCQEFPRGRLAPLQDKCASPCPIRNLQWFGVQTCIH